MPSHHSLNDVKENLIKGATLSHFLKKSWYHIKQIKISSEELIFDPLGTTSGLKPIVFQLQTEPVYLCEPN